VPQFQHAAQLLGADSFVKDVADVLQGDAQIFQGDQPVEARELTGLVIAVPRCLVDASRRSSPVAS
jgi:hypothetical protein